MKETIESLISKGARKLVLNDDRLFSSDDTERSIARDLYKLVKDLPIISPHGHTDPSWFAKNENFSNATELFLAPDHYVFRMLYSQGIDLKSIGVGDKSGASDADPREAWKIFANNYYLMRGTPSSMWLNHVFVTVLGLELELSEITADYYYDTIGELLATDAFKPRALFEKFNIELISTTESPIDTLPHHQEILKSGWKGRVISAYRPDNVIDPEHEAFFKDLKTFGELTGEDTSTYKGYIRAHEKRREYFKSTGVTSTDHGHPSAFTIDLSEAEAEKLFNEILKGNVTPQMAETFRGHMLMEMARMSLKDGLVMQIHPGVLRNHNTWLFDRFGRDKGGDIPMPTDYVNNLRPLLNKYGNEKNFTLIIFTLDDTSYSRELGPLAGHYPAMKLGPAWWFNDSPEGMLNFREGVTPTAGFYNTIGFNDDTRAFFSIPARHDMARRIDARYLAKLVSEHRLTQIEASEIIQDLAYKLPKQAYKL